MPIVRALQHCYRWSYTRPQAIGYGFVLMGMATFRAGDLLMLAAGVAAVAGGIVGAWKTYVMEDE